MTQEITMGSLFSGSGGFELAGSIFGIRPIWASEIEPFPILVTTKNFPEMKHLGDINKLNGADLEPVTIIAGGSPCQDMSIAGKREGLDGSRSNLFREQIRIIKEMRESDRAAGRTGNECTVRISACRKKQHKLWSQEDRGGMPQDADGEERSNDDGEYG